MMLHGTNSLAFWTGNGDGTFAGKPDIVADADGEFYSAAAADFNGDGNVDLLLGNPPTASSLSGALLLFGDGNGNFAASPQSLPQTQFATVADFNADGRPDIATLGPNGVSILLGGLAAPTLSLTQVPPSPFDFGQTVSLIARVTPDPDAFQSITPTGNVELQDGSNAISVLPLNGLTAYFVTNFVPQTHNFTSTYIGDSRDQAASASLTVVENGPPAAISPVSSGFPLQALVVDANDNPIPNVAVTFSAPPSGPSGLFSGNPAATVLTDSRGIATAPVFVANGISGSYSLMATTTIGGISCSFALANP